MEFKQIKKDLLIEVVRQLFKDPTSKTFQKRFVEVHNAKTHDDLNPTISTCEYAKLIDLAYAASTVGGHIKVTLENNLIKNAEIAPPGTKGFHSPASFLI